MIFKTHLDNTRAARQDTVGQLTSEKDSLETMVEELQHQVNHWQSEAHRAANKVTHLTSELDAGSGILQQHDANWTEAGVIDSIVQDFGNMFGADASLAGPMAGGAPDADLAGPMAGGASGWGDDVFRQPATPGSAATKSSGRQRG